MTIILFCDDLMTVSQVEVAAREAGLVFRDVSSADAVRQIAETSEATLVVLDLACPAADPAALVPQLKTLSSAPRVIAFGPHVHAEKLAAAQAAGCDQVLSRGQFLSQLGSVLGLA